MPKTHSFYLTIDSYGLARIRKSRPIHAPGLYHWRLIVTLPDPPPITEIKLEVPDDGEAELTLVEAWERDLGIEPPP